MDPTLPSDPVMALARAAAPPEHASPLPDGFKLKGKSRGSRSSRQVKEESADPLVQHCPDGRKCAWCTHKDSDWDPVELKRQPPVYVFMWWSYPPAAGGKTQGNLCAYCKKIFFGQVKVRGLTTTEYGN